MDDPLPERTPERWRELARQVGITEQTLFEYCRATGITPKEFFSQFGPAPEEPQ